MKKKILNNIYIDRKKISKCRILCIGDLMLDHYIYGKVHRISPEAPIPILLNEEEKFLLGGVGNVAKNLSVLGAKCTLLSIIGIDNASKKIKKLISIDKNIKSELVTLKNYIAPVKTRYIKNSEHLLRVDKEKNNIKKNKTVLLNISKSLEKNIKKCDLVIISDYDKGFLDRFLIKEIISIAKNYDKLIIADPKKNNLGIYANTDIITPNQKELNDAARKELKKESEIISFSRSIIKKYNINEILLTRSEKGMMLIGRNFLKKYKANAKKVMDVTGAGDTVISILALMKAFGLSTEESVQISNYSAGIVIGKRGTATLTYKELIS
tara:strand:- start:2712 stop:3686 length:975 start_codon:yes stop_codon:yes gene_type:complete